MRLIIHSSRLRALTQVSAILALSGIVAGCSRDASRIDEFLTASVATTSNQTAVINGNKNLRQAYPGDSLSTRRNGVRIERRNTADRNEYYQTGPIATPVTSSALPSVSKLPNGASVAKHKDARPSLPATPQVARLEAPARTSGPIVLQPRNTNENPLKVMGAEDMSTGSIGEKPAPRQTRTSDVIKPVGWKNTKGAQVTVKPGETLFNLSRRYGVPVSAIMSANNINDANSVESGRRILIPTYNYSNSVPVSAPDNDPVTRASRASRGFQGQARGRVALPKTRLQAEQRPILEADLAKPVAGDRYTVVSGDTLYGIALRNGMTSNAIRTANNMDSDTVRLGQVLTIPGKVQARDKVAGLSGEKLDKTETGSIPRTPDTTKSIKPDVNTTEQTASITKRSAEKVSAPKKTASASFRWPAQGRVITRFGERDRNGTNDGIDISVPEGTPIKASENGTVIYSGSELEDFGKLILVSHQEGWVSAYAHASSALVRRGDKVRRGQVIAKSGRTGNATVPKLHFELRKNSNPVNPLNHLAK